MRWADVRTYVAVLRALLRGEEAEWDGAVVRMMQPDGFAAPRPVDVPVLIGADGPKGMAVAEDLGDGLFSAGIPAAGQGGPAWRALLAFGTVLHDGEAPTGERVLAAAGPALAVAYHALYERGGPDAVDAFPGGRTWREAVEEVPAGRRHLAIHDGHLVVVTDRDRPAVQQGASLLTSLTFTGTAPELRERLAGLAAAGVTELAYQPAGPDIPGELERMMAALG
jgi:5,10-methylenetetrahydromethanopterin reductase